MKNKDSIAALNVRAVKLIHSWRKWFIPTVVLSALFNNLAPYVTLYMSAEIVNELAGGRNLQRLINLVLFTIIADLLIVITGQIFKRINDAEQQHLENSEKQMFITHGFSLDYEHMENTEIQQRRRKIDESKRIDSFGIWSMVNSLRDISAQLIQIILSVGFTASLFVLLFRQSGDMIGAVVFSATIVALIAASILVALRNAKKLAVLGEEITSNMLNISRISMGFGSVYQTGKDIRLYNLAEFFKKHRDLTFDMQVKGNRKYYFSFRNMQIPDQMLSQGINFTIYAFICLNALRGLIGIGSVIKYVGFISRLISALVDLTRSMAAVKMNAPFLQHYLEFFEIQNKMYYGSIPIEKRRDNEYEIEFCNVSFKYPGSDNWALRNLSMKLTVGHRMAVVGMNGSGKTTMIKLLCRLYDPTEGRILLNGIDIKKYDYEEYLNIFSVVFQDFKLFSFSLGQNVGAAVNYDMQRAQDCLMTAGFADRFWELPKGLDTILYKDFEEDGVEVSGGEAQKIALARALYKNAPFVVLDEPTAALDPIAEFEIYSKFDEIVGDKSAVYISHRLSSCRFCDDIVVFDEGRLVQRGSHEDLVGDAGGKYFELWRAQAQYYE